MEWTKQVRQRLTVITMTDAGRIAGRSMLPEMRKRIFDRGEKPDGGQIGTYSRKPIYLSLSQMSRTSVGQSTKGGKSKKFPGGYAQYKRELGAKGFNLRNFGVLMSDFKSPMEKVDGDRLRFVFSQKRSEIVSDNYPDAFGFSPEERKTFTKVLVFEIQKRLSRD